MFKKEPAMLVLNVYLAYLVLSLTIAVWVARTLHRSGRTFLVDAFHGQMELAGSVNPLPPPLPLTGYVGAR
jgi:hypothetical protein